MKIATIANTNAIRNKCYTHIWVLKTFMHKVITITGKQGPLLLPRSFNMKTIAQDLVRMLSFKLLYKAPELTVGRSLIPLLYYPGLTGKLI